MKRLLCVMAMFGLVLHAAGATAATVYYDDFDGTGDLNGTVPDVGTAAWTAAPSLNADGTMDSPTDVGTAYLPFVPESGMVYELSVDANVTTDTNFFFAMGFLTDPTGAEVSNQLVFALPGQSGPWMFKRGLSTADTQYSNEVVTQNQASPSFPLSNGDMFPGETELKIVLDTRAAQWEAAWLVDDQLLAAHTYAANPVITAVALHHNNAVGTFDNFQLTAVPEPSSLLLVGLGLGAAMFVRRINL